MTEVKTNLKPIVASDQFIERALEDASIPTLIMSLIHITSNKDLLLKLPKPKPPVMGEVQGFMTEKEKKEIRRIALDIIKAYKEGNYPSPSVLDQEVLHSMMEFMIGSEVSMEYIDLMLEEMDLYSRDSRKPAWNLNTLDKKYRDFSVVVIGAGMSGILAGIRLKQAGINFRIIEKNSELGGTWYENTYPGSRVDIANHFFCYSFYPNPRWSEHFSQQPEILSYFRKCAEEFDILDSIDFNSRVTKASYQEKSKQWVIEIERKSGSVENIIGNILISAVGQLNRPKIPEFQGKEYFSGSQFHSSKWDHKQNLKGKKVAVIGTGASSFQIVPELAKEVAELYVFQRSPAWMYPNDIYHDKVSEYKKWLLEHIPYYSKWYRFLIFWPGSDGLMPSLKIDPEWPYKDRSVNAINDNQRQVFTDYIKKMVGDDPDLFSKVLPTYPPFVKRMLQDNGSWLKTLKKENVNLITEDIKVIEKKGIVTDDEKLHEVEVIIYATGFYGSEFLSSLQVEGKDGISLKEVWKDEPEAYLGITIPNFPNLFCLYGPATNLAHAGTIIFHSECQIKYIMECIRFLIEKGGKELECKEEANKLYNLKLQEALSKIVFSHGSTESWYKNSKGKVVTTSPWLLKDYWAWTQSINPNDYQID